MPCEMCEGPTEYLGILGGLYWFRCLDCHWEMAHNELPNAVEVDDEDAWYEDYLAD